MMSPFTDNLTDYECRLKLEEIYKGEAVVLPVSEEHARCMLRVAEFYLSQKRMETWNKIKG